MFHDFDIEHINSKTIRIKGKCVRTKKPVEMLVSAEGYKKYYEKGEFIQDTFPELTSGQREYFVSGISEEGWNELFPPE